MNIAPLPKYMYEKAKAAGVDTITLKFQGGSDEGFLEVEIVPETSELTEAEVEEWTWDTYNYNGAGDGSGDYGDEIEYNLSKDTTSHTEWAQVIKHKEPVEDQLVVGS